MGVKVFLISIIAMAGITLTGFATWLFSIVNSIHQHQGGKPLQDPRGSWQDQANIWLSFLPSDMTQRTEIVCFIVAAYIVVSSTIAILAVQAQAARVAKAVKDKARYTTLNMVKPAPQKSQWIPRPIMNEMTSGYSEVDAEKRSVGARTPLPSSRK